MFDPKILVSKTLDGWTVTHITETGVFIPLSNPRTTGTLNKREAVDIAKIAGRQRNLPVAVGD